MSMIYEVIFGSGNLSKYKEIKSMCDLFSKNPVKINIVSIYDKNEEIQDVEETGKTFLENALLKANFFWNIYKKPVISEDSGLCIPILGGRPGIYSARYGSTNGKKLDAKSRNLKLLKEMESIPWEDRKAYFEATIVFILNDDEKWIFTRKWYGYIQYDIDGDKGFGYDPIFFLEEYQKTSACIDMEIKNEISHRAKSFRAFLEKLSLYLSQ